MNLECKTIKDILCGLDIQDGTCGSKACKFNDILSDFTTQVAHLNMSKIGEPRSGDGEVTLQTSLYPKAVHGFYVRGNCIGKPCFEKVQDCTNCHCSDLYIWYAQQSPYNPQSGQYVDKGNGEFLLNVPEGVQEGWMIYSAAPFPINDDKEEICLPPELRVGFRNYVRMQYAEYDRDLELAQYYQVKFDRWLERATKNDMKKLYRIYHPVVNG